MAAGPVHTYDHRGVNGIFLNDRALGRATGGRVAEQQGLCFGVGCWEWGCLGQHRQHRP